MTKSQTNKSNGMGLFGVLGVIFVVLKLVGVVHWSWIWVLIPFWLPFLFWLVLGLIGLIIILFSKE